MTSATTSIATDYVEKAISGFTEAAIEGTGTTKSDRTTLPDNDNMHAVIVDTASTPEKSTTPTEENTHTSNQFTPTVTRHTEPSHTTEEEIQTMKVTRTRIYEVVSGSYPGYYGHEPEMRTKWYHPKSTDNIVVPPECEFFATIVGNVASVLLAIIFIVILVMKLMIKLDHSYNGRQELSAEC